MRFHVVGLPHTRTSKLYSACAYTQKVLNFCKMMHDLGHEVYHYGAEGSEAAGTHIDVISSKEQEKFFGSYSEWMTRNTFDWDCSREYWTVMNTRVANYLSSSVLPGDFLCLIGGVSQAPVLGCMTPERQKRLLTVEYGVGYYGVFSKYRVFESHSHQSAVYAKQMLDPDVNFYDTVIPNYYDPADFPKVVVPATHHGSHLLYVGRLVRRKGLEVAVDVAKVTGRKLLVAGQGMFTRTSEEYVTDDGVKLPRSIVDFLGYADIPTRNSMMRQAHALIAPTTYLEPFGGVAVESQFCGTPAITTNYGGFVETVQHGSTGYRCQTLQQFKQAVEQVSRLLPSEEIASHAISRYSLSVIGQAYQRYFESLQTLWGLGWYDTSSSEDHLSWIR